MFNNIRNFCIIAHIDHGKSTLADRMLEVTGTVEKRKMKEQYLDQMDLERERGITIKMTPVRMIYHANRRPTQTETQTNADEKLLYKDLTYKIRGIIFAVKKNLGLGHKEIIYQKALEEEFKKNNIQIEKEKTINILYENKKIGVYRPDFIIDGKVILEIKSLPFIGKNEEQQAWSYLKGSLYKLALLVNFGGSDVEIKRTVFDTARFQRESASSPRESAQVEEYVLNLIDTPGHSDFSYEVSRALAAVDGAVLLVDASQGIQAQTLANYNYAKKAGLKIIGAINKIDLNPVNTEDVIKNLANLIEQDEKDILKVSGKTGEGVEELLMAIINKIPPPKAQISNSQSPISNCFQALVFDSFYHEHKGIVANVRVFNGSIKRGEDGFLIAAQTKFKIKELGFFAPQLKDDEIIETGQIGYIATGLKDPEILKIGDTIISYADARTNADKTQTNAEGSRHSSVKSASQWALPGYKEPQPLVFVSFYPEEADDYEDLKIALEKLKLNDSALRFEPDFNEFLGRGFKCGFLGRLHFEITAERLEREFNIKTINSFPSVSYKVKTKTGEWIIANTPKDFPEDYIETLEPVSNIEIISPSEYLGAVLGLQQTFRLRDVTTKSLGNSIILSGVLPLAELIRDFDDQLKSVSAGFASLSYDVSDYQKTKITKLEILVAGHNIGGLTRIVYKEDIEREARKTVLKLKDLLPRQQFVQAIQALSRGKIIARETIPAYKKELGNFGKNSGDRTRKMKLWKKQQKGKVRLKERGMKSRINVPTKIFKELLKK
ncbi:GxxExxY protein [Patescibacteria group bacterium]|nr:GxxExxY protein [Patescibacteria group bacterium]